MLLKEGVRVWGTARSHERLAHLSGVETFTPVLLDLNHTASVERAYRESFEQAGDGFDLVINNAGCGLFAPFARASAAEWTAHIQGCLLGTVQLAHLALRDMLQRNRGCIVNVSSVAVEYPLPFMSGYNIVKAGISALSESLIFETRGTGVAVIDFRPGDFRTAFNQSMQLNSSAGERDVDPRVAVSWRRLEQNLEKAPEPSRAASDLKRVLLTPRSRTVYTGSVFQAKLAPLFSRLAPAGLRRAIAARYFGAA